MTIIQYLQANPTLFIAYVGLLGLLIGSFLNVVIHRLPIMMERSWRSECASLTGDDLGQNPDDSYNLVHPRSACPRCGHLITAIQNIPILSYLFLKGRCSSCETTIGLRYPLVELLTGILSMVVAWRFGVGWETAAALPLTWALISASLIDADHQLLPDIITLPFLWLGLFLSLFNVFTDTQSAIIGVIAGYLSLWSIFHAFRLITGKEGMGYGDFKLLALMGAWMGWQALPAVVLLSSVVGAVIGILMIVFSTHQRNQPIPFGPYLATAGWIVLLWGDEITAAYYGWAGISL